MAENLIYSLAENAYKNNRRLVAPLVGFPGLNLYPSTIKLAQQNSGEQIKVLQAIEREFHPDVMFPLMDLSVEANALGQYTVFPVDDSATVEQLVQFTEEDLERLQSISLASDTRAQGYIATISLMKKTLPSSVSIGCYVSGPYTLTGLLIGASIAATYTILNPKLLHSFCKVSAEKITEYAKELVRAGAETVCFLEPSGVMLGPEQFREFSANYIRQIHEEIGASIPAIYHVCGNSMHLIHEMCNAGVQALSLDSREAGVDLRSVAESVPKDVVFIGNLCPTGSILTGAPSDVKAEVDELLRLMDPFPNFILSTGCDLPKQTPIENIKAFMEAGRAHRIIR
jgi:uroporphyrinogen decarboxylase